MQMNQQGSKLVTIFMALVLTFVMAGCSGGPSSGANEPDGGGGTQAPAETVTIKVSIWDRGNAPEGQTLSDTLIGRWINEQVKDLNIQVEFVPLPRSEESAKLNTWMASGTAPDLVLTYDTNTFLRFAKQGGLAPLDESLEKYGDTLKEMNGLAMEYAGAIDGTRYAIMANRPNIEGPTLKIRKDWLDALGLPMPTTLDEFYEVLKAFKEQDPGNVGRENVIPFSIPAFGQSAQGFLYAITLGAGVDLEGPQTQLYMSTGNIVDGEYKFVINTPEGRDAFAFMNKLYREGLIPKEFITDINSQKHTENLLAGYVGAVNSNQGDFSLVLQMQDQVEGVDWKFVPPFVAPDGEQLHNGGDPYGMYMMVPATSADKTDAVVKYLNWMADPDNLLVIYAGFEGEHYRIDENGTRQWIDIEKVRNEFSWYSNDMGIVSLGLPWYDYETTKNMYPDQPEGYGERIADYRKFMSDHAVFLPTLTNDRPWAEKNVAAMDALLYEEMSKVIIANDFDAAYDTMLQKWLAIGGEAYEAEITEGLKQIGRIK